MINPKYCKEEMIGINDNNYKSEILQRRDDRNK